jgi:hypothetical protein
MSNFSHLVGKEAKLPLAGHLSNKISSDFRTISQLDKKPKMMLTLKNSMNYVIYHSCRKQRKPHETFPDK